MRALQWLVIALTATMIAGIVVVVAVVVQRMPRPEPYPALPEGLTLPEGAVAEAVTFGRGFIAVVTRDGRILILDRATGALRQTVVPDRAPAD